MNETKINQEIFNVIKSNTKDSQHVGIFIDYDNTYYCMKTYAIDITAEQYDICQFLNEVYGMKKIRTFRAYADFDQVGVKLKSLQEQRVQIRNVYGNGKDERFRKNASDIELSLDALEMYYRNENLDTYVFVTADSDMIPIMSRLMYKGKNIHLYYTGENASQTQHIEAFCDFSCDLLKLFTVDIEKGKPEYWYNDIIAIITTWYNNPKNSGKSYGYSWLSADISKQCGISKSLIGITLNKMVEDSKLKIVTKGDVKAYYVVEENKIDIETPEEIKEEVAVASEEC